MCGRVNVITWLRFGNNWIGAAGCFPVVQMLVPELAELELSENRIGAERCVTLADALHGVLRLTKLDIGCSRGCAVGAVLPKLTCLDRLLNSISGASLRGPRRVAPVALPHFDLRC